MRDGKANISGGRSALMSAGRTDVDVNALKQAEPRETRASADTSLHVHELRARNIHISLVAQRRKKNKKNDKCKQVFL